MTANTWALPHRTHHTAYSVLPHQIRVLSHHIPRVLSHHITHCTATHRNAPHRNATHANNAPQRTAQHTATQPCSEQLPHGATASDCTHHKHRSCRCRRAHSQQLLQQSSARDFDFSTGSYIDLWNLDFGLCRQHNSQLPPAAQRSAHA